MTTTIASNIPGRAIATYDLLDELQERYGLTRRETHEGIHAYLDQLAGLGDNPVVDERPMRPELLVSNAQDVDVYQWIEITDQAAQDIRESFAAAYADQD
jgi:hypothetical protein